jgi:hypothetical protein
VMGSLEGDRGSVWWWLNDGGTTAQWQHWAEEEKCSSRGGVLLLMDARGGGRARWKRWAGRQAGESSKAADGQGGGRGLNVLGTAAPLFGPCG